MTDLNEENTTEEEDFDMEGTDAPSIEAQLEVLKAQLKAAKKALKAANAPAKEAKEKKVKVAVELTEEQVARLVELDETLAALKTQMGTLQAERKELVPRTGSAGPRGPVGIGKFIKNRVLEGAGNEEIYQECIIGFPENNTNLACINWYRGALKKYPDTFGVAPKKGKLEAEVDEVEVDAEEAVKAGKTKKSKKVKMSDEVEVEETIEAE